MLAFVRAAFAAALVCCCPFPPLPPTSRSSATTSPTRRSSSKPRSRPNAGQVAKPPRRCGARPTPPSPAQRFPHRHADPRPDRRGRARRQRQLAAARPRHPADPPDRRPRAHASLERAATAAYIAYQRTSNRGEEAESLLLLGRTFADRKLWRPALDALRLSLDLREVAERAPAPTSALRDDHGFRMLDYTVDADAASPRACFQFSEDLPGKRTDFSPFVARRRPGQAGAVGGGEAALRRGPQARRALRDHAARRPAVDRARRRCRSRPTSTSMCATASPFVRFTGKAYVLPRTGQRGIPVVSVNTATVKVADLPHRRPQPARHRARQRLPAQPRPLRRSSASPTSSGAQVWKGELKVEHDAQRRRHHRFPGRPGGRRPPARRLRDGAPSRQARDAEDYERARDPMVHRLRPRAHRLLRQRRHPRLRAFARDHARPKAGVEVRLIRAQQRGARRPSAPMRHGYAQLRGRPGARRGRPGAGAAGRDRRQAATTPSST